MFVWIQIPVVKLWHATIILAINMINKKLFPVLERIIVMTVVHGVSHVVHFITHNVFTIKALSEVKSTILHYFYKQKSIEQ